MSDEDDDCVLSPEALGALAQFYKEKEVEMKLQSSIEENPEKIYNEDLFVTFPEDWQLSQFWYDGETSEKLASEVKRLAGSNGKVACISCPSVFRALGPSPNVKLFEFDRRFEKFGQSFIFYDYNDPVNFPQEFESNFDVIIADPPFLSIECQEKVAQTISKLATKDVKIIFCTAAVMEDNIQKLLKLEKSTFIPKHKNNLGNKFSCFTNYPFKTT